MISKKSNKFIERLKLEYSKSLKKQNLQTENIL